MPQPPIHRFFARAPEGALRHELSLWTVLLCLGLMADSAAQADAPAAEPAPSSVVGSADAASATPAPVPPSPEASSADLERARQLFQHGIELAERDDFAGAAKSFSEALALRDAPAVEYNLAAALAELQQNEEAYNRTQRVLANPETADSVRERAKQLELSLQSRVARLTVVTSGSNNDLTVSIDGQALAPALLGRAQAVAPGRHEVIATRAGAPVSSRSVDIPLRTAALVDVSLVVTELNQDAAKMEVSTSTVPLAQPRATPVDSDAEARRARRRWIGIAAGVLAVGAGVTLGVLLAKPDDTRQEPLQGDTGVLTW